MSALPSAGTGAHADEHEIRLVHGQRHIGREAEATGLAPGLQELVEVALVKGARPSLSSSSLALSLSTPMTLCPI